MDHRTLRHSKYKNIFGLGDVNDLPTTNAFWAGFHQLHVVRNNLQRSLEGKSLNAEYDGYSKVWREATKLGADPAGLEHDNVLVPQVQQ